LPVLGTNRQQLEFDSLSRSTLLPVCTGPKRQGRLCRLSTKSTVLNSTCRQCVRGFNGTIQYHCRAILTSENFCFTFTFTFILKVSRQYLQPFLRNTLTKLESCKHRYTRVTKNRSSLAVARAT